MPNGMMSVRNGAGMTMDLQNWRGYSAYEIAVQNGFEGTLPQWLASLQGKDGQTTSVNGVAQQNGNVTLTGAEITVSAADKRTLAELAAVVDKLASALTVTEDSLDLGGRYVDNALFR